MIKIDGEKYEWDGSKLVGEDGVFTYTEDEVQKYRLVLKVGNSFVHGTSDLFSVFTKDGTHQMLVTDLGTAIAISLEKD